jgi:hypothetical protein
MKKVLIVFGVAFFCIAAMSFVKNDVASKKQINEEDLAYTYTDEGEMDAVSLSGFLQGVESGENFELPVYGAMPEGGENWNYTSMVTTYCP